ncbi:unnamed protein product [Ceratitis capitata]|uniref:(Mediterranean fruit fly) hypothetical protein n=1 Tax=Ceratitis capitata TaxID=7213 RepID=A0A811UYV7_CERCA|nr:unnamed protein product [Ceratitis capitata]
MTCLSRTSRSSSDNEQEPVRASEDDIGDDRHDDVDVDEADVEADEDQDDVDDSDDDDGNNKANDDNWQHCTVAALPTTATSERRQFGLDKSVPCPKDP